MSGRMPNWLREAVVADELAKAGIVTKHQRCLFDTALLEQELFGRTLSPSVAGEMQRLLKPRGERR